MCCISNDIFDYDEQTANVDSVECRSKSLCSLITIEDGALTREGNQWVDSRRIQLVALVLLRRVCKSDRVTDVTSVETCWGEPRFFSQCGVKYETCNVTVTWDVAEDIVVLVVDVLVTRVEYSVVGSTCFVEVF